MTKSSVGAEGYVKVAIGYRLATLSPNQREHEKWYLLFLTRPLNIRSMTKSPAGAQGDAILAVGYRLAKLFPKQF